MSNHITKAHEASNQSTYPDPNSKNFTAYVNKKKIASEKKNLCTSCRTFKNMKL